MKNEMKMLRAMRLANEAKNRKSYTSKSETRAHRTEKQSRAKSIRHSERQHIESELFEFDRVRPVDAWAGAPSTFLKL
jgi:hypothetical protein